MKSKEKILEAAIDLYCEKGFPETSMRDLAKRAGLKASSLYSHYAGKEEILDAVLALYTKELLKVRISDEDFDEILNRLSPEEILTKGFVRILETTSPPHMTKIVRILVMEMYRNSKIRSFYRKWYFDENRDSVIRIFKRLQEKGAVKNLNLELLASLYGALLNYFYHEYFLSALDKEDSAGLAEKIQARLGLFMDLIKTKET